MTPRPLAFALLLVTGCMSPQQTSPAITLSADRETRAARSEFQNLLILPRDISREELTAVMRSFSRALGVKCSHCHVANATDPEAPLHFASDAKEEKRVARVMLQMTMQINDGWLERVEAAEGHDQEVAPSAAGDADAPPRVSCWTCHRGEAEPAMQPPPPPRQSSS